MNIGQHLTHAARRWPDKTAIVFEGRRLSFSSFDALANRAANAFSARGIRAGDTVAFMTWNRPEQVASFYGLLKLGAVPVPVSYRLAANEARYIVEDCKARIVVFDDELAQTAAALVPLVAGVEEWVHIGKGDSGGGTPFARFIEPACDTEPAIATGGTAPAFIMYTSGTTGRPKGVVRSHDAEAAGAMAMALDLGFRHDDVLIHNKPLFHIAQLQLQFLPCVMLGATGVMTRGYDVDETLSLVESERITALHGVPTQLVMMMQADLSRWDLSALRLGFFGGQTLNEATTRACLDLFSKSFVNVYGSTEILSAASMDYVLNPDRLGATGAPIVGMEARVIEIGSGDVEALVAPGDMGELILRGPSMFSGYLGLPERTAETIRDGWYFSGDCASSDERGFLSVQGRIDFTIKSGGENVHPAEVENVLFAHPDIVDAAVVGLPSDRWGDVVCAAIKPRPGSDLTAEALDRFCRESPELSNFKRPRHYFFVEEIPASSTGKVERRVLRAQLLEAVDAPLDREVSPPNGGTRA